MKWPQSGGSAGIRIATNGRLTSKRTRAGLDVVLQPWYVFATRAQQPLALGLDRRIAFAGALAEPAWIIEFDMSAAVTNQIALLQRVGHQRHAVAARADHLGHRFLRQHQLVAAGNVARLQQTSRQPGFDAVR